MSGQRDQYTVSGQEYARIKTPVTITISAEMADFLTRIQTVRNEYKQMGGEPIALVDMRTLAIGRVIAFERT